MFWVVEHQEDPVRLQALSDMIQHLLQELLRLLVPARCLSTTQEGLKLTGGCFGLSAGPEIVQDESRRVGEVDQRSEGFLRNGGFRELIVRNQEAQARLPSNQGDQRQISGGFERVHQIPGQTVKRLCRGETHGT